MDGSSEGGGWTPEGEHTPERMLGKIEKILDQQLSERASLQGLQVGELYDALIGSASALERIGRHKLELEERPAGELWMHAAQLTYQAAGAVLVAIATSHGAGVTIQKVKRETPAPGTD